MAAVVTTNDWHASQLLPDLLAQVDEEITHVSGDGAYDRRPCYEAIGERQARALIPPQHNATMWQHGNTKAERLARGWCCRSGLMGSHRETKLIAIDKQTNDNVVHLSRPGKADRFAREPLDSRTQRQMFPFNPVCIAFASDMRFRNQMPGVCSPMIGKEAGDPKGLQQGFEL